MSLFLKASRLKLRFPTSRGELTVEQLWDLPLTSKNKSTVNLDDIAVELHSKLQTTSTISFVNNSSKTEEEVLNQLRFDIAKEIIDIRQLENKKLIEKKQKDEKRALLRQAIEDKQKQRLLDGNLEDLQKELALLDEETS